MEPITCPACGFRVESPGARHCTNCGASLVAAEPGGAQPPGAGTPETGGAAPPPRPTNSVPLEDTSQPFFQRLLRTIGLAFSDPVKLFSNMASGDIALPLLYGVLIESFVIVISIVWHMMFNWAALLGGGVDAGEFAVSTGVYILIMFLSPVFAAIGLFISSAIFHVCLLIFGDGQRGFAVTFRAVAYGNTPALLCVIPLCGGFAGGIWALILTIIGGKVGHGTDAWRAILAYFLPTIVCCCLAIWLLSTFGLLGALSR